MSAAPRPWRLIVHPGADGAWNMAVDEAIVSGYTGDSSDREPTLRLYGWHPATLSLGRTQTAAGSHDARYLRAHGIGLVRRPTGGRAVLHDRERTYAVAGSLRRPPFRGGVVETYRRIAGALVLALRGLGVPAAARAGEVRAARRAGGGSPACFAVASTHEIEVDGRKLVGSAQLRRGGAFLQHGSILMGSEDWRLAGALGVAAPADVATDLRRVLRRDVEEDELDAALTAAFGRVFGVELRRGNLREDELMRATRMRCWKYDSAEWTLHGRLGERERRWGPAD